MCCHLANTNEKFAIPLLPSYFGPCSTVHGIRVHSLHTACVCTMIVLVRESVVVFSTWIRRAPKLSTTVHRLNWLADTSTKRSRQTIILSTSTARYSSNSTLARYVRTSSPRTYVTRFSSDVLDSLQKRAMNVVFPGYDGTTALTIAGVDALRSCCEELTRRFFTRPTRAERDILSSLGPYLLPPKRKENITAKLRRIRLFENSKINTNIFLNTFIPYCIRNLQ